MKPLPQPRPPPKQAVSDSGTSLTPDESDNINAEINNIRNGLNGVDDNTKRVNILQIANAEMMRLVCGPVKDKCEKHHELRMGEFTEAFDAWAAGKDLENMTRQQIGLDFFNQAENEFTEWAATADPNMPPTVEEINRRASSSYWGSKTMAEIKDKFKVTDENQDRKDIKEFDEWCA
ncbi:hypothetical protein TrLO_g9858 [Triparma laevis f. longispina]|uniref:Uncharacterized protein n=1 Tax=Triparma laevis f. longispina TaxID=1714387 RepID=A0A9W7FDS8_9STRA|nr:hypothetical protein TrLO_g9858 [Triparma laevis f. longispina]